MYMLRFVQGFWQVLFMAGLMIATASVVEAQQGGTDNSPDWFYPAWAADAKFNQPITVKDTESALGRYALKTKQIGLKDLARFHGHLCDGLVISYIEIRAVLDRLFQDGVIDRTDLRAVSKNGPCVVDAVSYMTGARINFNTLRLDPALGEGFIIQRISTGEAYKVKLKAGIMPEEQIELENSIRRRRGQGEPIESQSIDLVEKMANQLIQKIINTPPENLISIQPLTNFHFIPNNTDFSGERGDVINKSQARNTQ